eukprot:766060-Hanusia_phi.AAC.4
MAGNVTREDKIPGHGPARLRVVKSKIPAMTRIVVSVAGGHDRVKTSLRLYYPHSTPPPLISKFTHKLYRLPASPPMLILLPLEEKKRTRTDAGFDILTERTRIKCGLRHQIQDQEPIFFKTLEKCANMKFPILNEYWQAKGHLLPPLQRIQGDGQCYKKIGI